MRVLFGLVACLVMSIVGSNSASAAWVYNANSAFVTHESGGSQVAAFSNFKAGHGTILNGAPVLGSFVQFADTDHTDAWLSPVNTALQGWSKNNASGSIPAIVVNTSNGPVSATADIALDPSQILMHAGGIAGTGNVGPLADAVLRFTTTNAGVYKITGAWEALDANYTSGHALKYILKNGVDTIYTSTLDNPSINLSGIVLATNDTIDFVVSMPGGNFYGSTGLTATLEGVAAVPEPTTLVLFGLAGIGLTGIAKRRRARKVA